MTFFCPNCWKQMAEDQLVCSRCSANISNWETKTFAAKLLQALSPPEPQTQMRAVYLLGETKDASALDALGQVYRTSHDPFLQGEVIKAVSKIGGDFAVPLLIEALEHSSFIVRCESRTALLKYSERDIAKCALAQTNRDFVMSARDGTKKTDVPTALLKEPSEN